jgi:hypothetical protein
MRSLKDSLLPFSRFEISSNTWRYLIERLSASERRVTDKPWSRLEQVLKATDLLFQAGGFVAIVLDMSDVLPQHTMRIPLATWYRLPFSPDSQRPRSFRRWCMRRRTRCYTRQNAARQPPRRCGDTSRSCGLCCGEGRGTRQRHSLR